MKLGDTHHRSFVERYFAFLERRSLFDRLLWHALLLACVFGLIYSLVSVSQYFAEDTPRGEGVLREGIVGTPRFVNPVLATSRVDRDMTALVYEGLLSRDVDGELTPAIAESVTLDETGTTYTITLRDDAFFHDGEQLQADDVVFTYQLIKNPELKSPLRGNWEGVSVTMRDDTTLEVTLPDPYIPFKENFTVGILPKHIWESLPIDQVPFSQFNTNPVGNGLYQVSNIEFSQTGLITSYDLVTAPTAISSAPYITSLQVSFYSNETQLQEAFAAGDIDSSPSFSTDYLATLEGSEDVSLYSSSLPRSFALFYNQNRSSVVRDEAVRQIVSDAIDKPALIATVLNGYGIPIDSPVPESTLALQSTSTPLSVEQIQEELLAAAWEQAEDGTWQKEIDGRTETLTLSIQTANTPLFLETAAVIEATLEEAGIDTTVEPYEQADLVQDIIRPRSFEVLLFGNDIGASYDLYPFWHSSQREDPGLNVAQYTNIEVDELLETLRTSRDATEREEALSTALTIIATEQPATFLFAPQFTYAVRSDAFVSPLTHVQAPHERFSNIEEWFIGNESLWPIFQ